MAIPKRINVGEQLDGYPALTHNFLVDHALRGDRSQLTDRAPTPGQHTATSAARIVIQNNSGQDIEAFEVVQLVESVFDVDGEAANRAGTLIAGAEVPAANGPLAFAITPIKDGEVGPVAVVGAVCCQVNITDTTHTHARRIDGDPTKLVSGRGGYPFLRFSGASGTGDEYCLVMLERSPTTIVVGQVKKSGGVVSSDAEFDVDNLDLVTGDDPRDDPTDSTETVTFTNTFAQEYADNELVMGFSRDGDEKFDTDKVGSGSGDVITEFELTEDMAYADTFKLAKPLDGSHNLDTAATAIRLLDLDGKWYGKAAYTSTLGSERGYRFFARFVTSNHDASGVAGWEIIAGEGPAPMLRGTLVTWTSTANVTLNVSPDRALGGGWSAGRLPEEESLSYDLTATDEDGLAEDASAGAGFLVAWSQADETYRIVAGVAERFVRVKGKPTSGVTNSDPTFTLGTLVAVCGDLPSGTTITVTNEPPIDASTTDDVFAICDLSAGSNDADQWTTADAGNIELILKGLPNYNAGQAQILWADNGTLEWNTLVSENLVTEVVIELSELRYRYKTFQLPSAGTGETTVKIEDVTACS